MLGLKPWDLDRMSATDVASRLEWIKGYRKANFGGDGDDG